MTRKVRNEVGLDIVCRDHPRAEPLFRPRMDVVTREVREAGRRDVQRGVQVDGDRVYSRRCPQPVRLDDGTVARWPDGRVRLCGIAPEFQVERVTIALLSLADAGFRRVHVVTEQEWETLIRYPQRLAAHLAARDRARSAGP